MGLSTTVPGILLALFLGPVLYSGFRIARALRRWNYIAKRIATLPDAPGKHWLWGTLKVFPGPNEAGLRWFADQARHHKAFKIWFGPWPILEAVHPHTVKVLLATPSKMSQEINVYNFIKPWLGTGLLISEGAKWHRNRKLLTPAFHFNILKPYVKVYNDAVDIFLDKIERHRGEGSVEIFQPVSLLTLDIIMRCAFSYHDNVQETGENHPYVKAVNSLAQLFIKRAYNIFHHHEVIYRFTSNCRQFKAYCDYTHKVSEEIIRKRKKSLEDDPSQLDKRHLDFLDILLTARDEDGTGLTDIEIRNEVDTFLFEGHDTTASALSWILYSLAKHPEHQRRCQEEIDALFADKDGETDFIIWDNLSKIPYVTLCIKEAMRLHTPVPYIARDLLHPLVIDGVTVPAGATVECNIWAVHYNANVWGEDCYEFKPERFSAENMSNMDSHAFVAFSAGPRNCIGQNFAMNEEKTVVSRILRRYWLEVDETHKVEHKPEIVMRAKDGIKLNFVPR